ncbi:hypothetical protein OTSUT76_0208 [Orientia tsutsugamushi str. UT76]|nr:hypothetical protein OTSUT76_0208 [Orientia tsutsugamushi str. UT76]
MVFPDLSIKEAKKSKRIKEINDERNRFKRSKMLTTDRRK